MIEGFEKALSTMSVGERCLVTVTDSQKFGYGKDGVSPLIPPHAELEMEIEVFDAEEQKNMGVAGVVVTGMSGSGDLGNLDPSKPVSQSCMISMQCSIYAYVSLNHNYDFFIFL